MKNIHLAAMSLNELDNLERAIAQEKKSRHEKQKILAQVSDLLAEKGLSLADLITAAEPKGAAKLKGSKAPIKYRNPSNSTQEWSGRGRTPKWLQTELDNGSTLADFEV